MSTLAEESTGPYAYTPAGSYHHHFLIVLAFVLSLNLARLGWRWLAPDTGATIPLRTTPGRRPALGEGGLSPRSRTPSLEQRARQEVDGHAESSSRRDRALQPFEGQTQQDDSQPRLSFAPIARYSGSPRGPSLPVESKEDIPYHTILDDAVFPTRAEPQDASLIHTQPDTNNLESPSTQAESSLAEQESDSPLDKALIGRSVLKHAVTISILAVGVASGDFVGPTLDLEWLRFLFPRGILHTMTGGNAVRWKIFQAIWVLFQNADRSTFIVLYFTGHSEDSSNAFRLENG
ncbi:hypothetical protein FRC09_005283 [Ceratobasidium sp. 395]|nr:hypothetical protein FRC09_005283 [Ceratobasidium sp. 395]